MAEQQLDLEAMRGEVAEKAQEILGRATEFAREKPHVAVGVAFGVGWVLGNGLPPRVILVAARLGWKAILGGALAGSGLMSILGEAGFSEGDGDKERAAARGPDGRFASQTQSGGIKG